jgi:uncharacterized membrane protein YqjE
MKQEILKYINQPEKLEKLYRTSKNEFQNAFDQLYPDLEKSDIVQVWHERLHYEPERRSPWRKQDLYLVFGLSLIAGLIAKIPDYTSLSPDYFFPRNISFIVFPVLAAYFAVKRKLPNKQVGIVLAGFLGSVIYINILPGTDQTDTFFLACIHLPLVLWMILGYVYAGASPGNYQKRLSFLSYNGDLVVMTTLILISGGLFTAITLGLFELIDLDIEDFYFEHIAIWGIAAAPVIGTHLVRTTPQLVGKVTPVIAKIFTPVVFIMLSIYLVAVLYTGKDPYNDREFLIIFNALLVGVMAIILFSISENSEGKRNKISLFMLSGLSVVTVILNLIALSAIIFRIWEWGVTPNRAAVLGINVLIFMNLIRIAQSLIKNFLTNTRNNNAEKSIAQFLPIYALWVVIVTFLFPLLFGFS